MKIGSLFCGSIHETPFDDNSFDIGACIGVLEYFEKSFVEKALIEIHRIMKPGSRFVLDIPNNESPMRRIMNMLEEYRGCPVRFDMSPQEFDVLLQSYFKADKVEILESVAMIRYFLRRKK
jgi:SAM-dependent methyltransferase